MYTRPTFKKWLEPIYILVFAIVVGAGCSTSKPTAFRPVREKTLIGETEKGWLKYKFYLMPADNVASKVKGKSKNVVFSIQVINMQDATSPLRKLCSNLDDYNIYYEYLLNQTKNDLTLTSGKSISYPVYYAFENNYNAFPFETINVGYSLDKGGRSRKTTKSLLYVDKIFAHDTIRCNLALPQKL